MKKLLYILIFFQVSLHAQNALYQGPDNVKKYNGQIDSMIFYEYSFPKIGKWDYDSLLTDNIVPTYSIHYNKDGIVEKRKSYRHLGIDLYIILYIFDENKNIVMKIEGEKAIIPDDYMNATFQFEYRLSPNRPRFSGSRIRWYNYDFEERILVSTTNDNDYPVIYVFDSVNRMIEFHSFLQNGKNTKHSIIKKKFDDNNNLIEEQFIKSQDTSFHYNKYDSENRLIETKINRKNHLTLNTYQYIDSLTIRKKYIDGIFEGAFKKITIIDEEKRMTKKLNGKGETVFVSYKDEVGNTKKKYMVRNGFVYVKEYHFYYRKK